MLLFSNEAGVVESPQTTLSLFILLILIAVISVITIFLFKKRKFQLKLAMVLLALSIILVLVIVTSAFLLSGEQNARLQFRLNLIFPVMVLIFSVLAYRGIKKDEELVKSYDRLR